MEYYVGWEKQGATEAHPISNRVYLYNILFAWPGLPCVFSSCVVVPSFFFFVF